MLKKIKIRNFPKSCKNFAYFTIKRNFGLYFNKIDNEKSTKPNLDNSIAEEKTNHLKPISSSLNDFLYKTSKFLKSENLTKAQNVNEVEYYQIPSYYSKYFLEFLNDLGIGWILPIFVVALMTRQILLRSHRLSFSNHLRFLYYKSLDDRLENLIHKNRSNYSKKAFKKISDNYGKFRHSIQIGPSKLIKYKIKTYLYLLINLSAIITISSIDGSMSTGGILFIKDLSIIGEYKILPILYSISVYSLSVKHFKAYEPLEHISEKTIFKIYPFFISFLSLSILSGPVFNDAALLYLLFVRMLELRHETNLDSEQIRSRFNLPTQAEFELQKKKILLKTDKELLDMVLPNEYKKLLPKNK